MKYLPVVIAAEYRGGFNLEVEFDNGTKKIINCKQFLKGDVFVPLLDEEYFKKFIVDGWSISWPNGADIAPETLYLSGEFVE